MKIYYLQIENFNAIVIPSNKTVNLFNLRRLANNKEPDFHFESEILIYTNISILKVPLLSYDGKLKMVSKT